MDVRVALPVWAGRLSPVFDVAKRLMLVELSGTETVREEERILETADRVRALADYGVELLICGAISRELEARLLASGIEVIREVRGPLRDVLRSFIDGTILEEVNWMPGCEGRWLRP